MSIVDRHSFLVSQLFKPFLTLATVSPLRANDVLETENPLPLSVATIPPPCRRSSAVCPSFGTS